VEILNLSATFLSILASIVAICAAIKARRAEKNISVATKNIQSSGGINIVDCTAKSNKGGGFNLK